MVLYVLNETLIYRFNYWNQGLRQGMRYRDGLYTHLQSYPIHERSKAYSYAFEEMERGVHSCITVSQFEYNVWASLLNSRDSFYPLSKEVECLPASLRL